MRVWGEMRRVWGGVRCSETGLRWSETGLRWRRRRAGWRASERQIKAGARKDQHGREEWGGAAQMFTEPLQGEAGGFRGCTQVLGIMRSVTGVTHANTHTHTHTHTQTHTHTHIPDTHRYNSFCSLSALPACHLWFVFCGTFTETVALPIYETHWLRLSPCSPNVTGVIQLVLTFPQTRWSHKMTWVREPQSHARQTKCTWVREKRERQTDLERERG